MRCGDGRASPGGADSGKDGIGNNTQRKPERYRPSETEEEQTLMIKGNVAGYLQLMNN